MPNGSSITDLTKQQVRAMISRINWFHTIDLGNGIVTDGDDNTSLKLRRLKLPPNLNGKTFLDIGAWDGAFSFEAEKRGAARVLALDSYVWDGRVPGKSKVGFLVARDILKSKVEDAHLDPLEISHSLIGSWDVVLMAGVLYHVKHPWLALEKAAAVTKELMIVETFIDLRFLLRPAIAFYPIMGPEKDHTNNWCGPNIPAITQILQHCGFNRVDVVYKSGILRSCFSAARRLLAHGYSPFAAIQQGRCVIHAYR